MTSALKSLTLCSLVYKQGCTSLNKGLHAIANSNNVNLIYPKLATVLPHRNYADTYFTKKHEYITIEPDSVGRVGVSDYAQEKLGDVVYVQLPEVGNDVERDDEVAAVESVKAASEIYSPVSGSIVAVNEALESDCALINKSAMDKGWIYKLNMKNSDELKELMNEAEYEKYLQDEAEQE